MNDKVDDLTLGDLLRFDPEGGVLRFGSQRALVLDTMALGLLRRELIDTIGLTAARGILTRFGFAHGMRTAESMKDELTWESERQWRRAGTRFPMLQGFARIEAGNKTPNAPEGTWHDSYEAEQHRLHLGRSEQPVCWTLCGFASGYMTRAFGREVYFLEDRCAGAGDPCCHAVGKSAFDWGPERAEDLAAYQQLTLPAALATLAGRLKRMELKLKARQRELGRIERSGVDRSGLVVKSEVMRRLIDLARRVARVELAVLITGESGAGKERIARLIHEESTRAAGPFVAINCGAVVESLLESELFGHARGAFTGANDDRIGLLEEAQGGTLLLDEIGEMSAALQVKLLRALQMRELRRVGENRSRSFDARIIAATNRDLEQEVAAGRFRSDLYYRIKVVQLVVPPLRQRSEDVLPIAREMLAAAARRMGRRVDGFSSAASERLLAHRWPGNVRELENSIELAVALAGGPRIELDDLPEELRRDRGAAEQGSSALSDVEREHILRTLAANDGNQTVTAKQLAIAPATLYRRLRDYGAIQRPRTMKTKKQKKKKPR